MRNLLTLIPSPARYDLQLGGKIREGALKRIKDIIQRLWPGR